jgi:hypothetical protein
VDAHRRLRRHVRHHHITCETEYINRPYLTPTPRTIDDKKKLLQTV